MKRVLLVTGHYLQSRRKAGFHFLADAFWRTGWEVTFFTGAISWLSWLRRDFRFAYPVRAEANRLRWVKDRLVSYVWFTRWHPANLRFGLLNRLARRKFTRYGELDLGQAAECVPQADLIIFESTPALLLFERFKRLNPNARYVYRVSDDLRVLNNHAVVLEQEQRCAGRFDLVSTPNEHILRKFEQLGQAALHHHGICKEPFDQECSNPYPPGRKADAVFVGNTRFDYDFLDRASRLLPDWAFHIVGSIPHLPKRSNIAAHGEVPFEQTVPYTKHADIGLHNLTYSPGAECFADSLKVIQYTYCRLPIVAPEFMRCSRPNMLYYRPGSDESIRQALLTARSFDRSKIATDQIRSWEDLAAILAGTRTCLQETGG